MPFAEDIEDVLDTIAQTFGMSSRGLRIEMAAMVDEMVPGLSPIMLRGIVNQFLPTDVAARTSLGSFAPGTDYFLAGADRFNALQEIGGPIVGMLSGMSTAVPDAIRALAGDERVSLNDAVRNSPVTMMRAFGDAYAYTASGDIIDRRGYVLNPDVTPMTITARMLGWYPRDASLQYDIIRYSQRMMNYQREVSGSYRTAWIRAHAMGDTAGMRSVERAVANWNQANKGTALEIKNFRQNARKALMEARRPGTERYLRTVSRAAREDVDYVSELFGY